MSLSLRPFGPADIPAGLRLCRACRWNQVEDDWRAFVDLPGAAGCLAQRDGAVAGSAAFLRYENFSWIAMMLVDPQARRAGIASRLMDGRSKACAANSPSGWMPRPRANLCTGATAFRKSIRWCA